MKRTLYNLPLLLMVLTGLSGAQGDDCSNPKDLGQALGTFPFDTLGFADSPFEDATPCAITTGPGENFAADGFFKWIVPSDGDYQFVAEGANINGAGVAIPWNIQMAIYSGSDCSATCLVSDDNTGFGSQALIGMLGLQAGQQLLIQVGGYDFFNNGNPTTFDGTGSLTITPRPAACQNTLDDSWEPNDSCASPISLPLGTHTDLFLSVEDPDFFAVTIPPGQSLIVEYFNSDLHLAFSVYDDSCSLLGFQFTQTWIRNNPNALPLDLIIQPRRSNLAENVPCSRYDLALSLAPDPCTSAMDDAFEDNDFSNTAAPLVNGFYPDLFITTALTPHGSIEQDHYQMLVDDGYTVRCHLAFSDATADVNAFLLNSAGAFLDMGTSSTDDETVQWTNNTGTAQSVRLLVLIQNTALQYCTNYDLQVTGLDGGVGVPFCIPTANSTGMPTRLIGTFDSGTGSGLHLESDQGPTGEFGYFLVGNMDASPGIPLGDGTLCLVGNPMAAVYRFNVPGAANSVGSFDAAGVFQNQVGTSGSGSGFDVPQAIPAAGPISAGSTWHFQLWHRDGASSNLSLGLSVTF